MRDDYYYETTADDLYKIADDDKIEIDEIKMREITAMSFPFNCIAIDPTKFQTTAEYNTALAHEIAHCQTASFYNDKTPLITKQKCEYTANKRAIEIMIPKNKMFRALKRGYTEPYQLAELFNVPEKLVKFAAFVYFDKSYP